MNEQLKLELQEEIKHFAEQLHKFRNKELSVKDFKSLSCGFGSYAQRGADSFMIRLRMNQGVVSKQHLKFVIDTCNKYNISDIKFTTGQNIQFHNLTGDEIPSIMLEALEEGIICRGSGGDFPRNVMASPLSGVNPEETFDVLPYAHELTEYLLAQVNKYSLPRKIKSSFCNTKENETHATFRDLGFVANEDHTFDVYIAGGLGNQPKMGVKVGDHVPCEDILYYASTMVLFFMEHGNYVNRTKARSRFIQETLGVEGLISAFKERLEQTKRSENLKIHVQEPIIIKTGEGTISHPRAIAQKQKGLYAVYYHPICASITLEKLKEISTLIEPMQDVELRITPQQGCYIINLTAQEAKQILDITDDGAKTIFDHSVSCVGAKRCQIGMRDSHGTLEKVINYIREKGYTDGVLPRIYISGCTSSCGTNQIGHIGLQGTVKVLDKKPYPAYFLSFHGEHLFNKERFGEVIGVLLEEDACAFFDAIAQHVSAHNMTYEQWLETHKEELEEVIATYVKPLK